MLRPYLFRRYASVLLSQSSRGGQNTSTSSVSSSACASCGGGAAPALAPAARGARAGGYARRGCVLSATRGLAQQNGRVPATVGSGSFFLLSYSTAARRVILSERAERARREGSAGAYEKRILRACGAQDDRPARFAKEEEEGVRMPYRPCPMALRNSRSHAAAMPSRGE